VGVQALTAEIVSEMGPRLVEYKAFSVSEKTSWDLEKISFVLTWKA
jgi:hypothetical protein